MSNNPENMDLDFQALGPGGTPKLASISITSGGASDSSGWTLEIRFSANFADLKTVTLLWNGQAILMSQVNKDNKSEWICPIPFDPCSILEKKNACFSFSFTKSDN